MTDYRTALGLYKRNYLEYKLTGNAAYKTAYENAQKWIETYLTNLEKELAKDTSSIEGFVKDYPESNPQLDAMKAKMSVIRKDGPKLQDTYETLKKSDEELPEDMTPYYVKGIAVAGILGVIAAVSLF